MGSAAFAQEAATHDMPLGLLNTTGRTIQLPVPLKDGTSELGEINVRIDPGDQIRLSKNHLAKLLTETLSEDELHRLTAVGGASQELTLDEFRQAGFVFEFDKGQLELNFIPDVNQRGTTELSLGGHARRQESAVAVPPAAFSGYLNILAGLDHIWGSDDVGSGNADTGLRFDLQGVLKAGGFVLENRAVYEGPVNADECPIEAYCVYQHEQGFKRRATRIVYDRPEDRVRVQIGDTETLGTGTQNSPELLGFSVEKSHRKLAPGDNVRPTGSHSFNIERHSKVDVVVNGAVLRRLDLRPGSYNLRDLPLTTGANEVDLIITDDTGHEQLISFSQFFDHNLLAAGQSEWGVAGGITSALENNARSYREDDYFGTGFVRMGVTDDTTVEGHMQGDARVLMGGFGVFRATAWGAFGLEFAASSSDGDLGYSATASWAMSNFEGPAFQFSGQRDSFYVTATYQSDDFRKPGEFLLTEGDIIYPQNPFWLRTSANYTTAVAPGVAATLSGRFQLAADEADVASLYTFNQDRYGADLTLSTSLGGAASASLAFGYSNEFFLRDPTDVDADPAGEFRVYTRVYLRPDSATRISTTYDSLNDNVTVSAHRDAGRGIDRWATSVDVNRHGYSNSGAASASAIYYGNRAEVRVNHRAGLDDFSWNSINAHGDDQQTSVQLGTAIAFADGKVAVGAPIRGDAFAIVHPHESLRGKEVEVREGDYVKAVADGWGPALISRIPVYTDSSVQIDVPEMPIGYSLGAGAFDLRPSYKAGHVLEVGSDHSVTVYGSLANGDGAPVGLVVGEAYRADSPERRVEFFTNASGKFAAEGLSPGHWVLEAATEFEPTRFSLNVPDGTEGLLRIGTLKPAGRI